MMKRITFLLTFLLGLMQGVCAQTVVTTEDELRSAFTDGADIQLGGDIMLNNNPLSMAGGTVMQQKTVTIDLNGHTLSGGAFSQIFLVEDYTTLNVSNGTLDLGFSNGNGGAIGFGALVTNATVNLTNVSMTRCYAKGDGGAIYCPAGGNVTLDGCTISGNQCDGNGGGIYSAGILGMKGKNIIDGNSVLGGDRTNVYLAGVSVIGLLGSLEGSKIGVGVSADRKIITNNYSTYHGKDDPTNIFSRDQDIYDFMLDDGEVMLSVPISYVEYKWNHDTKNLERYDRSHPAIDLVALLKEVGGDECFIDEGFYYVSGDLSLTDFTLFCNGNVSIILCDDSSLKLKSMKKHTSGLLSIYGQSAGDGELIIDSPDDGIGYGAMDKREFARVDIHGGVIKAEGDLSGISLPASIFGGKVTANGDTYPGISNGFGDIYIYGGIVNAKGGVFETEMRLNSRLYPAGAAGIGGYSGRSTYIYGGEVTATGNNPLGSDYGGAGIGGNCGETCNVMIAGGKVTATGGSGAPGIGDGTNHEKNWSGSDRLGGRVTIEGGDIYAYGGSDAAGIGTSACYFFIGRDPHCFPLRKLIITGGTIHAYGGSNGPGIGGSCIWSRNNIYVQNDIDISGGTIYAYGGDDAAGIGGTYKSPGGIINISGGEIHTYAYHHSPTGANGAGIGGGQDAAAGDIHISGGKVYAYGGNGGAGIGGGEYSVTILDSEKNELYDSKIRISGGEVYAQGSDGGAGIGMGDCSSSSYLERKDNSKIFINISGGTVTAIGSEEAAGIGGGANSVAGNITMSGGTVNSTGGKYGAAIGGGRYNWGGEIEISGDAVVTANGGNYAAGIGGGQSADNGENTYSGVIRIQGGQIRTTGGTDGAGIGGGEYGGSGDITISGGSVYAEGSSYGCGIGAGEDGTVKSIALLGGSVEAVAGDEESARAIGSAAEEFHGSENVSFGDLQKTMYYNLGQWYTLPANDRDMCAIKYQRAIIAECEHQGVAGTPIDANLHYKDCPYCLAATHGGVAHVFDDPRTPGYCTGCGIICADANADNSDVLNYWGYRLLDKFGLSNYSLHTDGRYNVVTLPFNLNEEKLNASCLKEAVVKQLNFSEFDEENGALILHFDRVYEMKAGQPYVVFWDTDENTPDINNPVFDLVTPNTESHPVNTDFMNFIGNTSSCVLYSPNYSIYTLHEQGAAVQLTQEKTLSAFRGYLQLANITPNQIDVFFLDGLNSNDVTGISDMTEMITTDNEIWYDLSGRKLSGKPTQKGIYIHQGRKIRMK